MSLQANEADLAALEHDLNLLPKAFDVIHRRWSQEIEADWRAITHEVDAIDSWNYLNSIAAKQATGGLTAEETKLFIIDNSSDRMVFYGDIVERGRTDLPAYPARFPAGKTLERQFADDTVDKIISRELEHFLHA